MEITNNSSIGFQGHEPTQGPGLLRRLNKARLWIWLKLKDFFRKDTYSTTVKTDKVFREKITEDKKNTVKRLVNKFSELLSDVDIIRFYEYLKEKKDFKNNVLKNEGLFGNKPSESISVDGPNRVLYPFVFPKNGPLSYAHIVLIAVDKANRKILYYDSQGLSSDDPSRVTKDLNMRKDLELLAKDLFGDYNGTIVENRKAVQKDPFNCGVFVLNALDKLTDNRDFESFLSEDIEDITKVREKLGQDYISHIRDKDEEGFVTVSLEG